MNLKGSPSPTGILSSKVFSVRLKVRISNTPKPDRFLYLAVSQGAYKTFFHLPFVETIIERFKLSLLVYDPNNEVILEWKR
ncbi:MAG: element excision factor XisH family protein [Rhizonema sp. PD38]|nr:element excision factor XisH family protein [Rhizonema sp. PD38]